MFCKVSHKVCYDSETLAEEALIQHHARQHHVPGRGPVNIYLCDHCDGWHFTSKGEPHPSLSRPDVQERIRKEREGNYWERKLRG
ncbi:MAG: hypothetical protein OEY56_02025 [Cyclobacteriaceae bacterium]|nr:hypothetical protein [Cyclobacteriaceae bacterium]